MLSSFPYPGLRPFFRDETDIFFGRETQTDKLLEKLSNTRFIAIIGPSGCGKSSLVRAGLIASLEAGFMINAGVKWLITDMRPGNHPIKSLTDAMSETIHQNWPEDSSIEYIQAILSRGPLGLIEVLREIKLPEKSNLLLLVDQFEEIFRFRDELEMDEADAFISMLIASANQRDLPIYVVTTMRSDFIDKCSLFHGLPEAINEGQFLIPRLTREQCKSAIIGPAKVFGGIISPVLVNNLLNDMGSDPDQLPLMQHLLMRMWKSKEIQIKDSPGEKMILTIDDYTKAGGLLKALSFHADEAYNQLNNRQKYIAEILFRGLSERSVERKDTRRPLPLKSIADIAVASIEEVAEVINVFRNPSCCFLTPACPKPLLTDSFIDISHECLIKRWDRMNEWVEREAESAEFYRLIEQTSLLWKHGKSALYDTPNLEEAIEWGKKEKPTEKWAERYGKQFKLVMEFIKASEIEHQIKQEEKELSRKRELEQARELAVTQGKLNKWYRKVTVSLVTAIVLLALLILGYFDGNIIEHHEYYNAFVKKWGIPVGIGKLKMSQVKQRAFSFRLIRKGRFNPVTKIEALNGNLELTEYHNIGTYFEQEQSTLSSNKVCQWEFVLDKKKSVVYEKAFDKDTNFVWGFVYSPLQFRKRFAHFVDSSYFPSPQLKSSAYVVELIYSKDGYDSLIHYYDINHIPIIGPDNAYGRKIICNKIGLRNEIYSLDLGSDNKYINDKSGNALLLLKYDGLGNILEEVALDDEKKITTFRDGYAICRIKYDLAGNQTDIKFFNVDSLPAMHKDGYHERKDEYDSHGNVISQSFFDCKGNPKLLTNGYSKVKYKWSAKAELIEANYYDENNKSSYFKDDGYHSVKYKYRSGNIIEISYFDTMGMLINNSLGYAIQKLEYDMNGNIIKLGLFGQDSMPVYHNDGYHGYRQKWDGKNLIMRQYLDDKMLPCINTSHYCAFFKKYNFNGNEIEVSYVDKNGKPVLIDAGYAIIKKDYDSKGNIIKTSYFDISGKPIKLKDGGYSICHFEYDSYKNRTHVGFFNKKEIPVISSYGYASYNQSYDKFGNRVSLVYLDENNKPIINYEKGFAELREKYDRKWNLIEENYFDQNGKPVLIFSGYSGIKYEYDDYGNIIATEYIDTSGNNVTCTDGYAKWNSRFNENGKEVERTYLNRAGQITFNKYLGYARVLRDYFKNQIIKEAYYSRDTLTMVPSKGYAYYTAKFDIHGNLTKTEFFGLDHKPVKNIQGYAAKVNEFNLQGNPIKTDYLGLNGEHIMNSVKGYSSIIGKYNRRNQLEELATFNTKGKLVVNKNNYARSISKYDTKGNLIETANYDEINNLIEDADGSYKIKYEYDSIDRKTRMTYYGFDDKPSKKKADKYTSIEYLYSDSLRIEKFLDENGKPVLCNEGYSISKTFINRSNEVVEIRFFDGKGEPINPYYGLLPHCFKFSYDKWGDVVEESYLDKNNKLFMFQDTYRIRCSRYVDYEEIPGGSKIRYYYDQNDNLIGTQEVKNENPCRL